MLVNWSMDKYVENFTEKILKTIVYCLLFLYCVVIFEFYFLQISN